MLPKRNLLVMALMAAGLPIASMAAGNSSSHTAIAANAAQDNSGQSQVDSDVSTNSSTDTASDGSTTQKRKRPSKLKAVEVTGFASSVQNSIATQRNSDVIVEAVSAEQIGKLPGVSIADTLGRLPGLAVQRLAERHDDLQLKPGDCVGIEDTAAGIASARGAGLHTLGVATTGGRADLAAAHRVIDSFDQVSLDKLREWFG